MANDVNRNLGGLDVGYAVDNSPKVDNGALNGIGGSVYTRFLSIGVLVGVLGGVSDYAYAQNCTESNLQTFACDSTNCGPVAPENQLRYAKTFSDFNNLIKAFVSQRKNQLCAGTQTDGESYKCREGHNSNTFNVGKYLLTIESSTAAYDVGLNVSGVNGKLSFVLWPNGRVDMYFNCVLVGVFDINEGRNSKMMAEKVDEILKNMREALSQSSDGQKILSVAAGFSATESAPGATNNGANRQNVPPAFDSNVLDQF